MCIYEYVFPKSKNVWNINAENNPARPIFFYYYPYDCQFIVGYACFRHFTLAIHTTASSLCTAKGRPDGVETKHKHTRHIEHSGLYFITCHRNRATKFSIETWLFAVVAIFHKFPSPPFVPLNWGGLIFVLSFASFVSFASFLSFVFVQNGIVSLLTTMLQNAWKNTPFPRFANPHYLEHLIPWHEKVKSHSNGQDTPP